MYVYAPEANQLDGILRPINPLMGANSDAGMGPEGWQPMYQSWALNGVDDVLSPMIRSDIATPTVDIKDSSFQFAMPALNGMGAVQDALSVLSVVDLLTRP